MFVLFGVSCLFCGVACCVVRLCFLWLVLICLLCCGLVWFPLVLCRCVSFGLVSCSCVCVRCVVLCYCVVLFMVGAL